MRQPTLPTYKTTLSDIEKVLAGELHERRKALSPQEGYTKAHVIAYYDSVAETTLSRLRSRPLIMERHPDGIAKRYS
jgi:bifunctional non-homologous end joining protein LigD